MLGMDHGQRSNAVGSLPSYLPDGDPGRQGGNTYTGGNSTEPTIQDYENIFGPSARDIKTDLQRFKRHGRWHLPDVLKGPNPWLTDRIDGLITDATNSPFTTKLLPYMYKEDVDGKMKWNVWSFDEGMASRVPYESAARTLTQSKRSFSGYMVRQGMAIVLEHNFMMSPKGRENFKNQLNQLIGSIQYTNDLDVHMALVLAPSHAKTMRERYYSLDKSPSQICREYVDLFGMMQKNVNALDILIEEGKAILRTWGGPMPDFLLCNSKLTFQMTMTPEKTNYITQGVDGIKRLKQGPDLGSYRGLSIIHSRSFSMETGQAPRDILRRRVRTAEYYRIPPSKKNVNREFEFYNEERDTWFTLSFTDLLRYALHHSHGDGYTGRDNASLLNRIYQQLLNGPPPPGRVSGPLLDGAALALGAPRATATTLVADELAFIAHADTILANANTAPLQSLFELERAVIQGSQKFWTLKLRGFDMGIRHLHPKHSLLWDTWVRTVSGNPARARFTHSMMPNPRFTRRMAKDFYESMKFVSLNDPFHAPNNQLHASERAQPGTPAWFAAFAFYLEVYKRGGVPMDLIQNFDPAGLPALAFPNVVAGNNFFTAMPVLAVRAPLPDTEVTNIAAQFLGITGAVGSVNHTLHLVPLDGINCVYGLADLRRCYENHGRSLGHRILMTYELLALLLREYNLDGRPLSGIDYLCSGSFTLSDADQAVLREAFLEARLTPAVALTVFAGPRIVSVVKRVLGSLQPWDTTIPDTAYLAMWGGNTWPMGLTTLSHPGNPHNQTQDERDFYRKHSSMLRLSGGHLSLRFLRAIQNNPIPVNRSSHILFSNRDYKTAALPALTLDLRVEFDTLMNAFRDRLWNDPVFTYPLKDDGMNGLGGAVLNMIQTYAAHLPSPKAELRYLHDLDVRLGARQAGDVVSAIADAGLEAVSIDMDRFFLPEPEPAGPPGQPEASGAAGRFEDVEIVVVRPNIEHNMLGVIMGLGGSELGHTLWGQTELSVYDDSMHGIWGMSYKYHERAIVFNEKNLIRLWDIAYDGYNGGKDDTYVDWTKNDGPNGVETFKQETMDVSKNYRGPSMMVMAFVHDRDAKDDSGRPVYDACFKRNWPSPIVFHDSFSPSSAPAPEKATLPLDYDNLQVVDVEQFRVFNNQLYHDPYRQYRGMMPAFHEMHMMRKSAGQSSADAETHTDSLAFQGSMRIKEAGRGVVEEIQGSGHHGPDYTGVASVRAGKGQKVAVQAPIPHRLI